MPFIEMSTGMSATISARMIRLGDIGADQVSSSRSGLLSAASTSVVSGSAGWVFLMRGAQPTVFPANFDARSSDVLVRFAANTNSSGGNFVTTNQTINPCNISTEYVTAILGGTATWFWFFVGTTTSFSPGAPPSSAAPYHQIIGSVGTPGSGADLIIPSTSIIAGEQYRILNLRIQFPTSWSY